MSPKRAGGFTLLELMVVITVLAILSTLAFQNYSRYAYRSRRSEGQQFLLQLAAAEERYFTNFNVYTNNITGAAPGGLNFAANTSTNGYYAVTATVPAGGQSYSLDAAPQAPTQLTDECKDLVINNRNQKTFTGATTNGNCW